MKAAVLNAFGSPLDIQSLPDPVLGTGEVIVDVVAAGVTSYAGDVFNGALAVRLAEGRPLLEAVRFAHAAAAISVTRAGAQPSIPTRREINALLKK